MADSTIGLIGSGRQQGPKRVTRTGLALVHENEVVYPAAGSAAEAVQAIGDAQGSIQVYFPVQVEIRDVRSEPNGSAPSEAEATLTDEIARAIDPG